MCDNLGKKFASAIKDALDEYVCSLDHRTFCLNVTKALCEYESNSATVKQALQRPLVILEDTEVSKAIPDFQDDEDACCFRMSFPAEPLSPPRFDDSTDVLHNGLPPPSPVKIACRTRIKIRKGRGFNPLFHQHHHHHHHRHSDRHNRRL